MPAWLIWLILSAALAGAEATNFSFVLIMFAGGGLLGSLSAGLGAPVAVQILVAVVAAVLLLALVRPPLIRALHPDPVIQTNADRLLGREAVVLQPVTWEGGRVRLNGAEWSARTSDRSELLPIGAIVSVIGIDGATAVVQLGPPTWDRGSA